LRASRNATITLKQLSVREPGGLSGSPRLASREANTPIAPPDADGRVYVVCSNVASSARRDNRQPIHEKVCTHGEWSFHLSWRQRLPAREVVADDEPQPYILERQSVQADETSN